MPIIPRANPGDITQISPLPGVRNTTRVDPDPYAGVAQVARQLTGDVQAIYDKHQDAADAAALMNATSQLSQTENHLQDPNNPEGIYSYQGINALQVHEKILPTYDKAVSDIESGLTSDAQKQRFRQMVIQRRDSFEGGLNSYALNQKNKFEGEAQTGFIQSSQDDLAKAVLSGNPKAAAIEANLMAGMDAFNAAHGIPAQVGALAKAQAVSGAYAKLIEQTAASDPLTAQMMFDHYGSKLTFAESTALSAKLKPIVDDAKGEQFVAGLATGGTQPNAVPANVDQRVSKLLPIIRRNETGGLANAQTAVSTAGATGTYQLMPDTAAAAAKSLGVSFSAEDLKDPAKNEALAKEHLRLLCTKFGSNEPAILAAYNMGEGAAEAWAKGQPYQTHSGAHWTPRFPCDPDAMPKETREYISKGLAGGPQPSRSNALSAIDAIDDPGVRRAAKAHFEIQQQAIAADRVDTDRTMSQSVYTKIENSDPGTPLAKVVTPDELAWINAQGKRDDYDKEVKRRISAVDSGGSLGTVGEIDQLFYQAANNDEAAKKALQSFNPFDVKAYPTLPTNMRQHFATMLTKLKGKDAAKVTADIKFTGELVNTSLFHTFGLLSEPTQKEADDDSSGVLAQQKAKFNQFRGVLGESIRTFTDKNGKAPTQADVQKMADVLLLQTHSGLRAFQDGSGGTKALEIPADHLAAIKATYPNADAAEIQRRYRLMATMK